MKLSEINQSDLKDLISYTLLWERINKNTDKMYSDRQIIDRIIEKVDELVKGA